MVNAATTVKESIQDRRKASVAGGVFNYNDICIERALGALCWDTEGKRYIDFAGGIGALNVGHCHPRVVEAIKKQAERLIHTSFHVALYEGYIEVCEQLIKIAPGSGPKKAMLLNSGAEAVENAVKIARRYTGRPAIIAFELGFHGRTLMGMTLTGKEKPYKTGFGPFAPEVYHAPYPYPLRPPKGIAAQQTGAYALESIERMFKTQVAPERVAAMIVEPVLGEGGFVVPTPDFLPGLRALCDKHGIVLIVDEIQTGFGRTGKMFACEHTGVTPDLMTVAKSLAAGMPLSAVVGKAKLFDAVEAGGLGGTYGGNPVACAAALAVFDIFKHQDLLARANAIGKQVTGRFEAIAKTTGIVGEVRGLAAMQAMELVRDRDTKEPLDDARLKAIVTRCREQGLLIIKAGMYNNVIRTLMPLVISDAELTEGLDILETCVKEAVA